jgi:hypothetical protein
MEDSYTSFISDASFTRLQWDCHLSQAICQETKAQLTATEQNSTRSDIAEKNGQEGRHCIRNRGTERDA